MLLLLLLSLYLLIVAGVLLTSILLTSVAVIVVAIYLIATSVHDDKTLELCRFFNVYFVQFVPFFYAFSHFSLSEPNQSVNTETFRPKYFQVLTNNSNNNNNDYSNKRR